MSDRCPSCFHFQRFCNCSAVVEAERILVDEWWSAANDAMRSATTITQDDLRRWFRRDVF